MASIFVIALVAVTFTGILDMKTDVPKTSLMVIEPKQFSYDSGLLPPPTPIFKSLDVTLADDISNLTAEQSGSNVSISFDTLTNIFEDYDDIVVFRGEDWEEEEGGASYKTNHVYLSKEPINEETTIRDFIFEENGIIITLMEKGTYTEKDLLSQPNEGEVEIQLSHATGLIREMGTGNSLVDYPTELSYIDDNYEVFIQGFLTNEQVIILAEELNQ